MGTARAASAQDTGRTCLECKPCNSPFVHCPNLHPRLHLFRRWCSGTCFLTFCLCLSPGDRARTLRGRHWGRFLPSTLWAASSSWAQQLAKVGSSSRDGVWPFLWFASWATLGLWWWDAGHSPIPHPQYFRDGATPAGNRLHFAPWQIVLELSQCQTHHKDGAAPPFCQRNGCGSSHSVSKGDVLPQRKRSPNTS